MEKVERAARHLLVLATDGRVMLRLTVHPNHASSSDKGDVVAAPYARLPTHSDVPDLGRDVEEQEGTSLGSFDVPVFFEGGGGHHHQMGVVLVRGVTADRLAEQHARRQQLEEPGQERMCWVGQALTQFETNRWLLEPYTLQLLRWLHRAASVKEFADRCAMRAASGLPVGVVVDLEYAPHVIVIPIASNTIRPFTCTNLVVIRGENECIIVDPGASEAGRAQTQAVLEHLVPPERWGEVMVFLTHHHHDHCEALDLIHSLYPRAKVLCHERTMSRVNTKLDKAVVRDGQVLISTKGLYVEVVEALGHTEGHMALWERNGRVLVAGDHIVGVGSAVLDAKSGGDMLEYFKTTRKLIDLQPALAIPAHGTLNYEPCALLRSYIAHQILNAITQGGAKTDDDILRIVYEDVAEALWPHARSNISLHIRKLADEQRLPASYAATTHILPSRH